MDIEDFLKQIISSSAEVVSIDDLKKIISIKKDIVVKVGFDPTTSNLHLGHLVLIIKLSQLQKLGFKICLIIGDCTALIGDPSGRSSERPILSREQVLLNCKTYIDQLFKFLNAELVNVYFNSSWYNFFLVDNFFKLLSFNSVSRMLERSDFNFRFTSNKTISINEFVYPLLQAYDSVFLDVDIELGGMDQKFNFLLGREIQRKFFQRSQIAILMPLLIGLDGKNKMSKSFGNTINLTDNFYDIFCKVMSLPDVLMKDYFLHLSFFDLDEYFVMASKFENPMDLKLFLAFKIVSIIYNADLAELAKKKFLDIFSKKESTEYFDSLSFNVFSDSIFLVDILLKLGFVSSGSEFKRLLKGRAISIDGFVLLDKSYSLLAGQSYCIKIGKKKFIKLFLNKV